MSNMVNKISQVFRKNYGDKSLIFYNTFCAIRNDGVLSVFQKNNNYEFSICHISRIFFRIRRNYFQNFIFFSVSMVCLYEFLVFDNSLTQLILILAFLGTMILAFKIKRIECTMVVIRFNMHFTEIKINRRFKRDAEEMAIYINQVCKLKSA